MVSLRYFAMFKCRTVHALKIFWHFWLFIETNIVTKLNNEQAVSCDTIYFTQHLHSGVYCRLMQLRIASRFLVALDTGWVVDDGMISVKQHGKF